MNWKKLTSLALSAALALSLAVPAMAAPPEGWTPADGARTAEPWYAEAQAHVMESGVMTGTPAGFEPMALVTRATVLETLWKLEGKPAPETQDTLLDVPGKWYQSSANWAIQTGLANGDGNGYYQGERNVTRAEVAAVFARYAQLTNWDVNTDGSAVTAAPDYDTVPVWAQEAMAVCFELGLMTGDQAGNLRPGAEMTRAELATILMNWDNLVPAYTEQYVEIEVPEQDDIPAHTVPGVLTLPGAASAEAAVPAVVMLHGTGSNKDEAGNGYATAAPTLALYGIATLRIDFMGNGDSAASYSDYCYSSANIDAKAAADYLAALDTVNGEELGVMGWSQGGTNALLAAAAYPETFQAVLTWSGALDLTTMFEDFDAAYATAKKDGSWEMTFDWRDSLPVGERWFKEVKETDVLAETAKIEAPVLAINGDLDDVVLPENADKIAGAVENGRVFLVEGADHTYNVFAETDAATILYTADVTAGFFREALTGSVAPGYVTGISKYGNVGTDVSEAAFDGAGYAYGDVLTITVDGQSLQAPYGTAYSNVDTGSAIVLPDGNGAIAIAINMGNFAKTYSVTEDSVISFAMAEKEGYLEEYTIRNIDSLRTNDRADYASDAVFANFRAVTAGDIADGVLYRSSSPVNPELGRNTYADAFAKEAGVKTIIDLADSEEEYAAYEGVNDSYAITANTVKLDMGVDFAAEDFAAKLKTGLEFMAANEGPYLVHCNEGKDRAGFVVMLLECLMGADLGEVVDDYMLSYENYYGVEHHSDRWTRIAQSNVIANLIKLTGVETEEDLDKADLASAAETYLTETVGLTAETLQTLKDALAGK